MEGESLQYRDDHVRAHFGAGSRYYDKTRRLPPKAQSKLVDSIIALGRICAYSKDTDIGCGTGLFSIPILSLVDSAFLCGIDLSPEMLGEARRKMKLSCLRDASDWIRGDATKLPLRDGAFDCVTMFQVFHLFPDKQKGLLEASRKIKPNGRIIVFTGTLEIISESFWAMNFPKFQEIELSRARFPSEREIQEALKRADLEEEAREIIKYIREYPTVEALIDRVSMKPFSTFSFYSDSEFKKCLKVFEKNLYERYGSGPVVYETRYLLLSQEAF